MTPAFLIVLAAVAVAWWVVRRAIRYRRDAAIREARALEALFISRHTADGGASIDVDKIFGSKEAPDAPTAADAVLRAAGLPADVAALLSQPVAEQPAAAMSGVELPERQQPETADRSPAAPPAARPAADPAGTGDELALLTPPPVRDLVQVFFEARGFRPAPAERSAQPIAMVLAHKSDAQRAYAFAPLAQPPSAAALESIVERARDIGQKRVLIAVEGEAATGGAEEAPAHGVRVLDRAAIEAQLGRLDTAVAERIRAKAWQRARQRLKAA